LRAYTADVAARAYAADGQRDACLTALDTAHTVLTRADDNAPSYTTYNEADCISIRGGATLNSGSLTALFSIYGKPSKSWIEPSPETLLWQLLTLVRRMCSARRLMKLRGCSVMPERLRRAIVRPG
jgi:hypothetical protein